MTQVISERKNLTEPKDWWEAFVNQAKEEGMTLSAWVGDCCFAFLPKEVRDSLSDRPPACRPRNDNK